MDGPVVLAVDLSEASRAAANKAMDWAKRASLPVVVVHALVEPSRHRSYGTDAIGMLEQDISREEASEVLDTIVRPLRKGGVEVETILEEADAIELVLRVVKEREASLLVVGRQGRGWLKRFRLGSVSTALASQAPCPVLLVPR